MPEQKDHSRRNAAQAAAVGTGLWSGGTYANHRADEHLKRNNLPGPIKAAWKGELKPAHGRYVAGKLAGRSLQVTGLPLAAMGVHHMVTGERTKKLGRKEVVRRAIRNSYFGDAISYADRTINKADMKPQDRRAEEAKRHRRATQLSTASGVVGVGALASRAPGAAKYLHGKYPKLKHLAHIARHEDGATKLSNALGVGSVGLGTAASFNSAKLGRLENQQVKKRDDKFLRQYRDRISPEAESGYRYLKSGERDRRINAAGQAALGAGLIGYSVHDLRAKRPGLAALGVLGGAMDLRDALKEHKAANGWRARSDKIKAKAYEREKTGVYGRNRRTDVAKALIRVRAPQWGKAYPKGILRKPSVRSSTIRRMPSGKQVSVRGSVG